MSCLSEEVEMDWTPPDLNEKQPVESGLLPPKSRYRYITAYENFISWQRQKKTKSFSEDVLMTYFKELSGKYKPSSLWSTYFMLKSTLKSKNDVDIKNYTKITEFIKQQSDGFTSKKSKVLTADDVEQFLNEAPDDKYLLSKVILIFGITGACKRKELANLSLNDIEHHGELLLVRIPDGKNKVPRSFTIYGQFYKIVKKYQALRVPTGKSSRFFQNYHKGKCVAQVVGANKIGNVPKEVATFLKLPNADAYTGHSFRRTSAILLGSTGADISLKRLNNKNN